MTLVAVIFWPTLAALMLAGLRSLAIDQRDTHAPLSHVTNVRPQVYDYEREGL